LQQRRFCHLSSSTEASVPGRRPYHGAAAAPSPIGTPRGVANTPRRRQGCQRRGWPWGARRPPARAELQSLCTSSFRGRPRYFFVAEKRMKNSGERTKIKNNRRNGEGQNSSVFNIVGLFSTFGNLLEQGRLKTLWGRIPALPYLQLALSGRHRDSHMK